MGDSTGSGKPAIPSWQLKHEQPEAERPEASQVAVASVDHESNDRKDLLEQASQFLRDDSLRDEPTDRKIQFLESKGLRNDEIQELLGVSKNTETNEAQSASTESPTAKTETKDAQGSVQPSSQTISPSASSQPDRRDAPPIITYPEFLYHAQEKPPLVSFQSVLYTLYAASGIAASIYGASEYLVKPMVATLTESRHELAETAQHNLSSLNEKLEKNVSTIPAAAQAGHRAGGRLSQDESGYDDGESDTSDPTELFHRDIATQTTPDLEQDSGSAEKSETSPAEQAVNQHLTRLQSISSQLNEARNSESTVDSAYRGARDSVTELQTYLDSLTYSSPTYLNTNFHGMYGDDSARDSKKGIISSGEEDAIAGLKAEVRSVKGALLSAKNFPTGGPAPRTKS